MHTTAGTVDMRGLRSALFWDFMLGRLVGTCRHFRTTYWSHLQGSSHLDCLTLKDGTNMFSWNISTKLSFYTT